jgi:periplasmic divalent cation tolerance protein
LSAIINVVTTVDGREALERIGRSLLERRLIACLQMVGPIKSLYWWKGSIEDAEEWIGIMKTRPELYDQVEKEIRALHPYDVPEIMAIEAEKVSDSYGKWVAAETLGP